MKTPAEEWDEYRLESKNAVTYNPKTDCIDIETEISGYIYSIDKTELIDCRDVVAWICHLCEKKWMTPRKIKLFIQKLREINQI